MIGDACVQTNWGHPSSDCTLGIAPMDAILHREGEGTFQSNMSTLFKIDEEQRPGKNNTDPMKYISVKYIC